MKQTRRIFVPGSEWVYMKIYTGNKTAETILAKHMPSITRELKNNELIEKWFFIRYADPECHLRIRFQLQDKQQVGTVVSLIYKRLNYLVQHNLIWKIQLDTYSRELERYGENLMEEAEFLFCKDSDCALAIIKKLSILQNENYRWMIALKMIDCFLSDFLLDIHLKRQLMDKLSSSFKAEFGFNLRNSKQFNVKFRENKQIIESVLNNSFSDDDFLKLYDPLQKKSKELKPFIKQFNLKLKKQETSVSIESLLSSYIHMMINRLIVSKNRLHELILYDFLRRYYASEIAKSKYQLKNLDIQRIVS